MLIVALLIGVILIVSAIRNSQGALFAALSEDVPGYVVWGAAIFAVGAVGWVPGLKPVARGLLALIILVIILNNYENIIAGFKSANSPVGAAGSSGGSSAGGLWGSIASQLGLSSSPSVPSSPEGSDFLSGLAAIAGGGM